MEETLIKIGLNKEEVEIYLDLLERGAQSASSIATNTKVKRTYVYKIMRDLASKGLVVEAKRGRSIVFEPSSPDHLLTLAEAKKAEANQAQSSLENMLSTLKGKYSSIEAKPVVTYHEGVEGIKKVYLDTLKEVKHIDALVETSKVHPEVYDWVTKIYGPKRVSLGITVKAIVSSGSKTAAYRKLDKKELRKTKLISKTDFPLEHEINIYSDKLAIINHKSNSKLIGIIIENPLVASTFKSWFNLTWGNIKS